MRLQSIAFLSFIAVLQFTLPALAALESVTLTSRDKFPAPRWMYGVGEMPKSGDSPGVLTLSKIKQAQVNGDDALCAERARSAKPQAKSLQAWLSVIELECAVRVKLSTRSADQISRALDDVAKNKEWFVVGPQTTRLKTAFASALLNLIDQDLRVNRPRAWKSIERVDEFANVLDEKTRASAWRSAGELSVSQQKNDAAITFFRRSLSLNESPEVRDRLASLTPSATQTATPTPSATPIVLDASQDEIDLANRATNALKTGDVVAAMDDAIKIIKNYSGGTRAKWATERVQEILNSFADKTDVQYHDIHDQLMSRIEQADADRLVDWGRTLYNRAQFADALRLSKRSLNSVDGTRRARALELASQSAIANEDWDFARATLNELIEKSAGQASSREAMFRLNLLNYRQGKYAEAISGFERLLSLPQIDNLELGSRYWLWRALQKTKSERAGQSADELMVKFPFSYYGLRARLEQGKGSLEWKNETPNTKVKIESLMWLTSSEKLAWEKAQILLKSGWLDEAQAELRELPAPIKAEDKAVRSLLWAAAGGYVTASRLANEAWDEKSELRRSPFTDAAFPKDFSEFIETQSQRRGLESNLVRGLIKQESSFAVRAVSSSNAYGLMQMIPPTAREIAQDLKMGQLKLPDDMFVPKRNIEMGTYYLNRMVNKYSGSVPLALASYNAGPGRIDRWLRTRASLKSLASSKSSAPDDEIWIDEIPYSETCFYVKAILRNIMLYRLLDQGRVSMPDPIWIKQ